MYSQTTWQRADSSGSLSVPLTCCVLDNADDDHAHMNPEPVDTDRCQDTDNIPNRWRHGPGCAGFLMDVATQELVIIVGLSLGSSVLTPPAGSHN